MKKESIPFVEKLIELAIAEDIGDGDHTSLASIPAEAEGRMKLLVKEPGIIAGVEVAEMVFRRLDPSARLDILIPDGTPVRPGDIVFYVSGRVRTLLQAERIVLNIMQRMTGVATETARYVERVRGTGCRILDTRKTTPGNRVLDKMAVRFGGGENHRMGLFDMILLKDNHVDFAGGIIPAIEGVRRYMSEHRLSLPIEVEVRSLEDIDLVFEEQARSGRPVDRIMLDNFDLEQTRRAVAKIDGRVEIESSGGIRYENLRDYAETGVDYISIGALTHQIKSVDLSLKASE
jgi:nicotinate-nucleotide pyrophosphorylase (carboxylating)